MKIAAGLFLALLSLSACYPIEQVRQPDERPSVLIEGAPNGAFVSIDGLTPVPVYGNDGRPVAIRVESGTHEIRVVYAGQSLINERVFLSGSGVKTIAVVTGGASR